MMGCWSESCVLSGMEISNGEDAYVLLMKPNPHSSEMEDRWLITVPPVRGKYDDYGGLDLTESCDMAGLEAGTNWVACRDTRGSAVYVSAEVMDFVHELKPEFPYCWSAGKSVEVNTVGEIASIRTGDIRRYIEDILFFKKEMGADRAISVVYAKMIDTFDRRSIPIDKGKQYVESSILAGETDFDQFLSFCYRTDVLVRASRELRKALVPGIVGPQHCGEVALIEFYKRVLDLAVAREKRLSET